jgi:transposase
MSSSTVASMRNDKSMNENISGPRAGVSIPCRSFTPIQKLEHVSAYEAATTRGRGGA